MRSISTCFASLSFDRDGALFGKRGGRLARISVETNEKNLPSFFGLPFWIGNLLDQSLKN